MSIYGELIIIVIAVVWLPFLAMLVYQLIELLESTIVNTQNKCGYDWYYSPTLSAWFDFNNQSQYIEWLHKLEHHYN